MITPASSGNVFSPRRCAKVLKALADETRSRLLGSLLIQEKSVTDLVRGLCCAQPHIFHHLRRDERIDSF